MSNSKKIEFTGFGGISGIGGSSILIRMDGISILLDCGINAGTESGEISKQLKEVRADIILLSHAHIDHIGALPLVAKRNPEALILATEPTKKLAGPMLFDAMRLSSLEGHRLYMEEDIEKAVASIRSIDFNECFAFRGLNIVFRRAGHILGAGMITIEKEFRITYTGDFSAAGTMVTPAPDFANGSTCDMLLCETTYGGKPISSRSQEETRFLSEISQVLQRGGRVLIPSFALGRAQEVIALLVASMSRNELPTVPVYIDGMVKEITEIFAGLSGWLSTPEIAGSLSDWKIIKPVGSMIERLTIVFGSESCVIVASSGMLSGGWSPMYAEDVCKREDSAIFFVGHLDEESPGWKLKEFAEKRVTLAGGEVPVTCTVGKFNLSAHAGHEAIMDFIGRARPRLLMPIHGGPAARWQVSREASKLVGAVPLLPYEEHTLSIDLETQKVVTVLSKGDVLADVFLKSLNYPITGVQDLIGQLGSYIDSNKITEHSDLESILWSIFKLCGNYVSVDPWVTITERANFFSTCKRILFERFPQRAKGFSSSLERSLPAFISNLVMYGANRAWLDQLKPVDVSTLDEVQAMIVSSWTAFDFEEKIGVLDVYHRCKLRVQWPSDETTEAKFDSIFGSSAAARSLLDPLPDWISTILVGDMIAGAYKNQVVVLAMMAGEATNAEALVRTRMHELQQNRLFQMTGWHIDPTRIRPITISDRDPLPIGMIPITQYSNKLFEAIKPFGEKAGGGTLLAFSDLPKALGRLGMTANLGPEFIEATHTKSGTKLLIAVDTTGRRFDRFGTIPGAVMTFEWFKFAIWKLTQYWDHKVAGDRGGLNLATDIITSLGWHSWLPENVRHDALRKAVEVYEFPHVWRELQLLQNFWSKKASHSIYADIAKDDRLWLENKYGGQQALEREVFKHEVRKLTGLQFSSAQYDRYFALTFTSNGSQDKIGTLGQAS
jgi:Cft2 family RNA processing exonuclease